MAITLYKIDVAVSRVALAAFSAAAFAMSPMAATANTYFGEIHVVPADPANPAKAIKGTVFYDRNRNGVQNGSEEGLAGVLVSDGLNVVKTDSEGRYTLPLPTAEEEEGGVSIFVTKPRNFQTPVDQDYVPQFSYMHKPAGSPLNVRGETFRYGGLAPTGPLPKEINFPLFRQRERDNFKIAVSGDTQAYSGRELSFFRDSVIKELAERDDIAAYIIEGDVMGDDLSLYPRYKEVVSAIEAPQYYVPGNHDLDFDTDSDLHSFDTFRREWGPEYYSFDIGNVHFVVLDDVFYPCLADQNPRGRHGGCDDDILTGGSATYNGVVTERQLAWLKNDLANVPKDKLVIVNKHIPIYSFIDQNFARQMVDNVVELYEALGCKRAADGTFPPEFCERSLLALSGHTHTNEQIRPGETFEGWNQELDLALNPRADGKPNSVGPAPFPQIVAGAAAGSWWSGDLDSRGIPESFQRLGAPRGYYIFEFKGSEWSVNFKAAGMDPERQIGLDMLTPEFRDWFETLAAWRDAGPAATDVPPFNINDLPDTKILTLDGIGETYLSANVWNGSIESDVYASFNGGFPVKMERTQAGAGENILETLDPFALKRQMMVARHAFATTNEERNNGFELFQASQQCGAEAPCTPRPLSNFFRTDQSSHVWQVKVPADLEVGIHTVKVTTTEWDGSTFEESLTFEVRKERPDANANVDLFAVRP